MSSALQPLFDAIRSESSANTWSRGVELVRADVVTGERSTDDEVVLRVAARAGRISFSVALYPGDEEWECECTSRLPVCEHVAAAVIALRRARKEGLALPSPALASGTLRYRFSRFQGSLAFQRSVVFPSTSEAAGGSATPPLETEREEPIRATIDAIQSGRVEGPRFTATIADVDLERALGSRRRGPMDRAAMDRLMEPLSRCPDVRLEGQPIQVSAEPTVLHGRVEDAPGGFVLWVQQDPSITERFSNDTVLCGDTLRAVGPSQLTGRELSDLPRGRFYPNDRVAELVTEALPSLQARLPVEILTDRLPKTGRGKPRIAIDAAENSGRLSVLATLVYGDPPAARIDAGRLVHLQGVIPIRDEAAERLRIVYV